MKTKEQRDRDEARNKRRMERHVKNFNSAFLNAETPPVAGGRIVGNRQKQKCPTLDCIESKRCDLD